MQGYIKLHRSIMDWEWYKDSVVKDVFLHLLLSANHEDKKYQGITIFKGQVKTGRLKLASELNFTEMQIRTALKKLKSTNEITIETTSQYSIITINNWDLYQQNNQQNNQQITNKQPTNNQQITTNKNDKNEKNEKNEEEVVEEEKKKIACDFFGEYGNVYLPKKNLDKIKTFVMNDKVLEELINELSETIASKSDRYKPYDENFPDAHFTYLKKFWEFRKNNPEKFNDDSGGSYADKIERMMKQLQAKDKL